jgi:cytidylate kinase
VIVTIDGPAGSGKSTAARKLAERLGFRYLDSGALYRAVTLAALERGSDLDAGARVGDLAKGLAISFAPGGRVLLDGRDVTEAIRSERVSANVSKVSAHAEVRNAMLSVQRAAGESSDLVCEGRDMGSVVFPQAGLKIYLDADVGVRAERRRTELMGRGENLTHTQLVTRIRERDRKDESRASAPLKRSVDQVLLDTTNMTIDEVVDHLAKLVSARKR